MGKKYKKNKKDDEDSEEEFEQSELDKESDESNSNKIEEDPEIEMAKKEEDKYIKEIDLMELHKKIIDKFDTSEKRMEILKEYNNLNNKQNQDNLNNLKAVPKLNKNLEKFDVESNYFIQEINKNEWDSIKNNLENIINSNNKIEKNKLEDFLNNHPKLYKGGENINKLFRIVQEINTTKIENYKIVTDLIVSKYFKPKPSILECYFFPDKPTRENETHVINMLRNCKQTLDIAIFSLTNDKIFNAIKEVKERGVKVRIIADDVNSKMLGSDVQDLCTLGIPCKTDKSMAYMHHKFAILDNKLVITGSFNWSQQAVTSNQENILFYENPELAQKYTEAYNSMWNDDKKFIDININDAKKFVKEKEEKIKIEKEKREKELAKKEAIKEKERAKKEKEKAKKEAIKEKEKAKKEKEKAKKEAAKEKEKIKKEKAKEKEKAKKEKEKAKKEKEKAKKSNK